MSQHISRWLSFTTRALDTIRCSMVVCVVCVSAHIKFLLQTSTDFYSRFAVWHCMHSITKARTRESNMCVGFSVIKRMSKMCGTQVIARNFEKSKRKINVSDVCAIGTTAGNNRRWDIAPTTLLQFSFVVSHNLLYRHRCAMRIPFNRINYLLNRISVSH